jgi:hypothetical protein
MNYFSPETSFRKPRRKQCGKRKRKPGELELRIIKAPEEGNYTNWHLSFFKGIIPSLHNFKEEETFEFQMWVFELIANIKHRNPSKFPSQSLPMYNQPFHTSTHVGRNNPLLVSASNMNAHHSKMTTVQTLAVETAWCRALRDKNRQFITHLCHLRQQKHMDSIINDRETHLP